MNILVTTNQNYLHQLQVMLFSLKHSNPKETIDVYLAHRSLQPEHIEMVKQHLEDTYLKIHPVFLSFQYTDATTTERYPVEMYDRLFAAHYLPKTLDRILYLDPDIIVKGSLHSLYHLDFQKKLFAGATHIQKPLLRLNGLRLGVTNCDIYVNTGVLLLNLAALRQEQSMDLVLEKINQTTAPLILPDQDIITMLYGNRILEIDTYRYNLSDRIFTLGKLQLDRDLSSQWVENHTSIIHFCGRNKPWKDHYHGTLGEYYHKFEALCFPDSEKTV